MSKDVAPRTPAGDAALFDVADLPTLQLDDIKDESETALVARGAAYAREYAAIEHKPTLLAKNLAMVTVALRIQYGDMAGKDYAYRQAIGEMYRQSGVKGDTLERLKVAVRWHVGNALRRQLTPRELKQLGLLETSPLERLQDSRAATATIVRAVQASEAASSTIPKPAKGRSKGKNQAEEPTPQDKGALVKATADQLRLAHVAGNIVKQMDVAVIDEHMTAGQRAKLDDELAQLQKVIAALRRHTRKPSSKA